MGGVNGQKSLVTKTQQNLALKTLDGRIETTEYGILHGLTEQLKTDFG